MEGRGQGSEEGGQLAGGSRQFRYPSLVICYTGDLSQCPAVKVSRVFTIFTVFTTSTTSTISTTSTTSTISTISRN